MNSLSISLRSLIADRKKRASLYFRLAVVHFFMMTQSLQQKVYTVTFGQNKVCMYASDKHEGKQNKPQICELKRTIIFWIYPFVERENKQSCDLLLTGQKKTQTMKPALNFIFLLCGHTHIHLCTKNAHALALDFYWIDRISESYNVIHTQVYYIKTFIVKKLSTQPYI